VIGLDLGGAELKGGVDHTRVQRIKFSSAGQLSCSRVVVSVSGKGDAG